MGNLPKSIALVYDRVNKWGGAEQVLLALHDLFPQAPIYTSVYNPDKALWAKVFPEIVPTFLQKFPLAKTHHELYSWLTPLAFETLRLDGYEAIISVTSADAKAIITQPSTFHLCYCLTPTRYLYSHPVPYLTFLKPWDQIAAHRPDAYVAISQTVQSRIQKYYHRNSVVVYPPVSIEKFTKTKLSTPNANPYFISVSRLVYHKQLDLLISLFNQLNLPLVIVGTGRLENTLRRIANKNIRFTGFVTDDELVELYKDASAYMSVHEEDFGISYVEAQAAGLPILALDRGGISEIVIQGKTGLVTNSLDELKSSILNFFNFNFDPRSSIVNSQRFSKEIFKRDFVKVFTNEWTKYKNTYMF